MIMAGRCCLRSLLKTLTSRSPELQILRRFSSSAAASRRYWGFHADETEDSIESAVYKHTLKFQRPTTIVWKEELHNTASFIGTVNDPPIVMNTLNGHFGVHTSIKVEPSRFSNNSFRVNLHMWDEIAEVSIKHLSRNDFIYVSGRLLSYQEPAENGKLRMKYKVDVKDINYVSQIGNVNTCLKAEQSGGSTDSKESALEKHRNCLHLWQVFFANPYEWWDNRKSKLNQRGPDFKHKNTGEALWLNPHDDPPWIRKQLQLHDSRFAKGLTKPGNYGSNVSSLVYDEL